MSDGVAKFIYCTLNAQYKWSYKKKFFISNCKLYYHAAFLFIYSVYCTYALYLVVYLYLHLAEQVQPYTQPERSRNVSP